MKKLGQFITFFSVSLFMTRGHLFIPLRGIFEDIRKGDDHPCPNNIAFYDRLIKGYVLTTNTHSNFIYKSLLGIVVITLMPLGVI